MVSEHDYSVPEGDEIKRVGREFADLNGMHLGESPDGDGNYDRGGSKSQDYEYNRSYEKSYREKSHEDSKQSKEYSTGEKVERERSRFSKTFKRKCNVNGLDRSKKFHECGMEKKDSYERHSSHERLEPDRDRDQDQGRDSSPDVQGSMKNSKGGQGLGCSHKPVVVGGLGAGGTSGDCCISDGYKVLERISLDSHHPSHVTEGIHSEHPRLPDGSWRAEGRTMDSPDMGHSKLASEGRNWGEVQTVTDGRTSDSRDPDMEALVKSVLQQDDLPSQEVRLPKVKVKVGGVAHTAHANSTGNAGWIKKSDAEGSSVSAKPPHATEGRRRRQRLILQENSDEEEDFPLRVEIQESSKKKPQVNTWASTAKMNVHPAKEDQKGHLGDEVTPGKQAKLTNNVVANQPVRKSSRVPKKRILDGEHYVDDDAEKALQIKCSWAMKKCVPNGEYDEDEECKTVQRRSSRVPKKHMLDAEYEEDDEVQQHKRWKRSKYQTNSEHLYHEDAEEAAALGNKDVEKTDVDLEGAKKRSKRKQGVGNSNVDDNKEVPLTARQRTMQSCKDAGSEVGANLIEFSEGLPQTSRRKRKEKLSEVEQQLKKTEAAQRRKMQLEKAANATQDEAIKKILGKDSSRKKREDKQQKQRDAMAQKKATSAMLLASNGVRWVMGPSGTVVTFSENTGLPSIFNNPPCRYPPPREKCAGPLCNNTYKYRDSKTNLPLCSLQCYRAIHAV
jgi:INO80 complex subunit B